MTLVLVISLKSSDKKHNKLRTVTNSLPDRSLEVGVNPEILKNRERHNL